MIIAHITDTHIKTPGQFAYRVVDTATYLRACVAEIARLTVPPDVVVATGDLVDRGHPDEYAHLRTLLAPLPMPVYVIPGNHDERTALRAAFAADGYLPTGEFLQYTVDVGPLRLVALDTLIPGEGGGELCEARLAWLAETLAMEPRRPTVILMHHPPFATGIGHMDAIGLRNADRFAEVVTRHPHVERVLCGHLHRSIQAKVGGTVASVAPSTAHQVALNLRADAPSAFKLEPPGFQLHVWRSGQMVSHTAVVGDFPGPYPFFKDGQLID
jgi:3',5'-cyclic AMP phosphodiesterase CpdA